MNITFYQFSKRNNSTKIVNVTGTTYNCRLKDHTDMINPVLVINGVPAAWNPIWNYCSIPTFDRYYFINNWRWINGLWECACTVDALASWKTEIGNMEEYVQRSSYECNGRIIDTAYPTIVRPDVIPQLLDSVYARALSGGFYVIGIISKEATATQGAITYYQMDGDQFARLRAYMLSDNFLQQQGLVNLADFIPADATKVIYNPYQYIASCQWFPFPMSAIPASFKDSVSVISFGWWNTGTGFSAYRIKPNCPAYEINIYKSWETHTYYGGPEKEYLNYAPYSIRILRMQPFGELQIPDDSFVAGDYVNIQLLVDLISGIGVMEVYSSDYVDGARHRKVLLARETQQISVEIQLAQIGRDYFGANAAAYKSTVTQTGMITSAVNSFANVDPSNPMTLLNAFNAGTEIGKLMEYQTVAIGDYMKAAAPQMLTSGSNGSLASYTANNYIVNMFYRTVENDNAQLGRPLYAKKVLNTIPGYMMIQSPDVSLPCTENEKAMISQYMTSGFFFE